MASSTQAGEAWILGGTGRTGRAVAARLMAQGIRVVLIGRDEGRLLRAAEELRGREGHPSGGEHDDREDRRLPGEQGIAGEKGIPGAPGIRVARSTEEIVAVIEDGRPAVVVNTIGGYGESATRIARAGMPGGHYVDLANDPVAVPRLLALHEEAAESGSAVVTGAGFGVLATEGVVAALCADRPAPSAVRVDSLASVATEAGAVGESLATGIVDILTSRGARIEGGRTVEVPIGADLQDLVLPDGERVRTSSVPTGELLAAQRASGAPSVTATSVLGPTSVLARAAMPITRRVLSVPALRRFVTRRLSRLQAKASPRPRRHSWGHAVVTWPDGTVREGWLRGDDAADLTVGTAAETASRLARGLGTPGAWTPATLFGPELAEAVGGTYLLDAASPGR